MLERAAIDSMEGFIQLPHINVHKCVWIFIRRLCNLFAIQGSQLDKNDTWSDSLVVLQ